MAAEKIRSTVRRASPAARSDTISRWPSAKRHSIARLSPSVQPSSRSLPTKRVRGRLVERTAAGIQVADAAKPGRSGRCGTANLPAAKQHQPGDNLVRIAERFYDDGDRWQLLYETNQSRRMTDGRNRSPDDRWLEQLAKS